MTAFSSDPDDSDHLLVCRQRPGPGAAQRGTGTGRGAAFPQNSLIWQQTSPGQARGEGRERLGKLPGWQSGTQLTAGTPRDWCWWPGSGNHRYRGRSQQGARPRGAALVPQPRGLRKPSCRGRGLRGRGLRGGWPLRGPLPVRRHLASSHFSRVGCRVVRRGGLAVPAAGRAQGAPSVGTRVGFAGEQGGSVPLRTELHQLSLQQIFRR